MTSSSAGKGNNSERWQQFLDALDEKLQLGLLDQMEKVSSYHFEEDILYLTPGSAEDVEYLKKDAVFQQLQILALDSIGVKEVYIQYEEDAKS